MNRNTPSLYVFFFSFFLSFFFLGSAFVHPASPPGKPPFTYQMIISQAKNSQPSPIKAPKGKFPISCSIRKLSTTINGEKFVSSRRRPYGVRKIFPLPSSFSTLAFTTIGSYTFTPWIVKERFARYHSPRISLITRGKTSRPLFRINLDLPGFASTIPSIQKNITTRWPYSLGQATSGRSASVWITASLPGA